MAVVAGFVSLFGSYWDDAWHTDRGRDEAWIPPHLVLYGAVAAAGAVVVGWGLVGLRRRRSVPAVLTELPLLLAGLGGAATLGAAPIDSAWHAAFGRDAVLWSPPHMLAVTGSAILVLGVVSGVARTRAGVLEAAAVALLIGALLVPVLEYETDVPQFSESWYLPVLLAGAVTAAALGRRLLPGRRVVAAAVVLYASFRLAVIGLLVLFGSSTPDLPIAVLGLAVVDLPWRTAALRYGWAVAAVSGLAWGVSASGVAGPAAYRVGPVAVPVLAAAAVTTLMAARRGLFGAVVALLVATGWLVAVGPAPAYAHDPGQGAVISRVNLSASSDGAGRLRVTAVLDTPCVARPVDVVARRAGRTVRGPLAVAGSCRYTGSVTVPDGGRWFLYVEFRDGGRPVEAWLPIDAGTAGDVSERRDLYVPSGTGPTRRLQTVAGVGLYGLIGLLAAVAGWQLRRREVAARRA